MVIRALTEKQSYIPYRNSKLTMLLQDSLGGPDPHSSRNPNAGLVMLAKHDPDTNSQP